MKRLMFGAVLALSAAGPASQAADAGRAAVMQKAIAAEKPVVAQRMKNPASARFRRMWAFPIKSGHLVVVCGEVSGIGDLGRYGGYALFIGAVRDGRADPDEVEFYDPTLMSDFPVPKRCQMAAQGKAPFYETDH